MSHQEETIRNFGDQWTLYPEISGFYGSSEFLTDLCLPLIEPSELQHKSIIEVGSGPGRIVQMLLEAGAAHITAIEPSQAVHILKKRAQTWGNSVTVIQSEAVDMPTQSQVDYVWFIGVLHHIPNDLEALKKAYEALKPGGSLFVWVYAREGNRMYLIFFYPLRIVLRALPDKLLQYSCRALAGILRGYSRLCRYFLKLPLANYFTRIFEKLTPTQQELVIFDQLNPQYSHYYGKAELEDLLSTAGFRDIHLHHRHGYSWSALGKK